jgi:hypothetical protein
LLCTCDEPSQKSLVLDLMLLWVRCLFGFSAPASGIALAYLRHCIKNLPLQYLYEVRRRLLLQTARPSSYSFLSCHPKMSVRPLTRVTVCQCGRLRLASNMTTFEQEEDVRHHVQHHLSLVEVQNLGRPAEVAAGCRCRSAVTLPYQNVGHCVAACALGARRGVICIPASA